MADDGSAERRTPTSNGPDFWTSTSNRRLDFVQHSRSLLEGNGGAVMIVPDNVRFEGGAGDTVRLKPLASDLHVSCKRSRVDPRKESVMTKKKNPLTAPLRAIEPQTYALMRIVTGFLFLCHGTQKLFGYPAPAPEGAPALVIYGAGTIELVAGALVMVGLFAGAAAFIASGQMAVAYWMAHGTQSFFPLNNGGELAAFYCFVFLFVAARGAGIWSLDHARGAATS